MGLLLPILLAKIVFYCWTLWSSFKALKVPKQRRRIPRPMVSRRAQPSDEPRGEELQTLHSDDPLTSAQKQRRTKIKEMTKVCLVWVTWSYTKRFLDWVAWAIPFYDELNFIFLIWLIVMGPAAAKTVFKYGIKRAVSPYETSLDSILGSMHDFLLVSIYLLTSGPRYLSLRWQKWKAKQFNKSLLSARSSAPPTRLPSLSTHLYHPQPNVSSSDHISTASIRPRNVSSQRPNGHSRSMSAATFTDGSANSARPQGSKDYPDISSGAPQRRPLLSRKLSVGYRRSVSNSSQRTLLEDRLPYPQNRPVSGQLFAIRAAQHKAAHPSQTSRHFKALMEPKPMLFGKGLVSLPPIQSSKENIRVTGGTRKDVETNNGEQENNSIVIHEDGPLSFVNELDENRTQSTYHFTSPGPNQYENTLKTRKRTRNPEDDESEVIHKIHKTDRLSPSSLKQSKTLEVEPLVGPPHESNTELAPMPMLVEEVLQESEPPVAIDVTAKQSQSDPDQGPSAQSTTIMDVTPNGASEAGSCLALPSPTTITDAHSPETPEPSQIKLERFSSRDSSSRSSNLPSHQTTPSPPKRRLHRDEDPLPLPAQGTQGQDMRDKALESVRSLESSWDLTKFESKKKTGDKSLNSILHQSREKLLVNKKKIDRDVINTKSQSIENKRKRISSLHYEQKTNGMIKSKKVEVLEKMKRKEINSTKEKEK